MQLVRIQHGVIHQERQMGTTTPQEPDPPDRAAAAAERLDRQTLALEKIAEGMQALHEDLHAINEALRRMNNRLNGSRSD